MYFTGQGHVYSTGRTLSIPQPCRCGPALLSRHGPALLSPALLSVHGPARAESPWHHSSVVAPDVRAMSLNMDRAGVQHPCLADLQSSQHVVTGIVYVDFPVSQQGRVAGPQPCLACTVLVFGCPALHCTGHSVKAAYKSKYSQHKKALLHSFAMGCSRGAEQWSMGPDCVIEVCRRWSA